MPRGPDQDQATLSSDLLRLLLESVATGEAGLQGLLAAAGVDPALLHTSHARIPAAQFATLWEAIEETSGDPCFGLHLGELRHGLPTGHVLFAVMLNSPTVGHALRRYCRYHDIMADVVQPRLVEDGAGATITLEPAVGLHLQHVECIFSVVASIVRHLARGRFEGRVCFSHPRPGAVEEHRRLLGPDVRFGQPRDAITIAGPLLAAPIPSADPELLELLEPYARRVADRVGPDNPWSGRVERALRTSLCDGKPSLARIARELAVSPRSLQSRLGEEGTTYQQLLDRVRRELATFYLRETQLPLLDLAFLLGYADQSAFNRSFRRWTGSSPSSYRGGGGD
jgi:AraC-like DNA-binding protein